MKKLKKLKQLVLLAVLLSLGLSTWAQRSVKMGTNPTTIDNSALLELESTSRGFLPPRMTTIQRNAIASPATGLVLYNTTVNCIQVNAGTPATPIWQCTSGVNPSTGGTAEASGYGAPTCAANTINGTLSQGSPASGVTMTLNVNVTQLGTWNIIAGPTNGVSFSGSGTFAALGCQTIILTASGTPTTSGSTTWTTNTTPSGSAAATVAASSGSIASLDCAGATANGTLNSGTAASGVSSVISYTGGNGSAHSGQTVTSTGVTGLTATLSAGTFASGAGTLTYTITGTPASSGAATFAISIGGQSCNLTRSVSAPAPPSNPAGSGSFSGKTCFDIALGNDNTNSCGPLSARTATQANFTQAATHTQSYTFTPSGTVSNVRFVYFNTSGTPVTAISGNNTGNNISTPVTATVNYVTTNAPFAGLTNSNPATVDIYVVYNDGATNNGTDRQLKLTANIKDCACCVAKVSATLWKEFLCHNLGANTSLDPHDMTQTNAWGLNGAYVQWGRRGPNTTGDSRVDWVTAANTSEFAAAPTGSTAGTANSSAISGWNTTSAANNAWLTAGGAKTAADPCPSGYRVPTQAQWAGVVANNTAIYTGAWTNSSTYYGSSVSFGPNSTTKLLTLPAAGIRLFTDGSLGNRGDIGSYWSSSESSTNASNLVFFSGGVSAASFNSRTFGFSVRCVAE